MKDIKDWGAIDKTLQMVFQERLRQMVQEGYSLEHDDGHTEGQMALLAAAYVLSSRSEHMTVPLNYTLEALEFYENWAAWFKPKDPIRDLVRAGALILAELERRLRMEEKARQHEGEQAPLFQKEATHGGPER